MNWLSPIFIPFAGMMLWACVTPQELTIVDREQQKLRCDSVLFRSEIDGIRTHLADTQATLQEVQGQLNALTEKQAEVRYQMDRRLGNSAREGDQKVKELEILVARMNDELRAQGTLLKAREEEFRVLREAVIRATGGTPALASLGTRGSVATEVTPSQPGQGEAVRLAYEKAWKSLERRNYRDAIARLNEFLKMHPQSEFADNAQYWIGESYYALKEFDQAILEFDVVRRKYPSGNKVPAALLKQGFAFAELGDKVDARLILQELIARYPQSKEAVMAKEKVKALES
jgi:tol-pal system protein YbgF